MEEEKYTVQEVTAQVQRALKPLKPLVQLAEMLQEISAVELEAQESAKRLASVNEELKTAEQAFQDLAQEFVDLQHKQKTDIETHQQKMHELRQQEQDKECECAEIIASAETRAKTIIQSIDERVAAHEHEAQAMMNELQEELDAKEERLAEINTQLALLKEKL